MFGIFWYMFGIFIFTFKGAHIYAVLCLVAQSCQTLCDMDYSPPGSSVHGESPGKNTEVGCHALLQGIFPTKGLTLGLPHFSWILYHLSHQGSPRILEWVAYPFFSGTSWPRNWTGVSCITEGFCNSWATWEALPTFIGYIKITGWLWPWCTCCYDVFLKIFFCHSLVYSLSLAMQLFIPKPSINLYNIYHP